MLYLLFSADSTRYVLATSVISEIAPLVPLRKLPEAPVYIAGLMNYRGKSLPIIDASQLLAGYDTAQRLSARIVVVQISTPEGGFREVGLLLERAIETLSIDDDSFVESGIENPKTPYFGKVCLDDEGMLQQITVENILSKMDVELLYSKRDDG